MPGAGKQQELMAEESALLCAHHLVSLTFLILGQILVCIPMSASRSSFCQATSSLQLMTRKASSVGFWQTTRISFSSYLWMKTSCPQEVAFNSHRKRPWRTNWVHSSRSTPPFCCSIQSQLPSTFFCPTSKGRTQPKQ